MGQVKAKRLLLGLANKSFTSRADIVECIAALASLFPEEMGKTCPDGRKIRDVLHTFTAPPRLEYLLNFRRAKQHLLRKDVDFVATGTAGNEALHKDLS